MHPVLIVYSTQTGRTRQLAEACAQGLRADGEVEVTVRVAHDAGTDDLLRCHGLILATPENFGYMSGLVKDFLDRTYYPAEGKTIGLPYGVLVSCGNDGRGAVSAIERIASGYQWKAFAEPLIVRGDPDADHLAQARTLGETLAAGLSVGAF